MHSPKLPFSSLVRAGGRPPYPTSFPGGEPRSRARIRSALVALALAATGACRDTADPLATARDPGFPRSGSLSAAAPTGCGRLLSGEAIMREQSVSACSNAATLTIQADQYVVLYDPAGQAWGAPNTQNRGTAGLYMQGDGNLVAYDAMEQPLWSSGTQAPGAWLAIQDDCNLVVYRGPYPEGGVLWASNTSCRAPRPASGRMLAGEQLWRGASFTSLSGNATLAVQADQNVVLYGGRSALWSASNTLNRGTSFLAMQTDGNLVAYGTGGLVLWHAGTAGHPGAWLALQDDCNLVIYRGPYPDTNGALWATGTPCPATSGSAVVTTLAPTPLEAVNAPQPVTLFGTGFTSGVRVYLRNRFQGIELPQSDIQVVSPTEIRAYVNLGLTPATWYVSVQNTGSSRSGEVAFRTVRNDYPSAWIIGPPCTTGGDSYGMVRSNCTSFVAWRLDGDGKRINNEHGLSYTCSDGRTLTRWSNAHCWDESARRLGLRVDRSPEVGAVAQWNSGDHGHVAYVAAVYPATAEVLVEEYNFSPLCRYGRRRIRISSVENFIHF